MVIEAATIHMLSAEPSGPGSGGHPEHADNAHWSFARKSYARNGLLTA